jgi:hypothetical protein
MTSTLMAQATRPTTTRSMDLLCSGMGHSPPTWIAFGVS